MIFHTPLLFKIFMVIIDFVRCIFNLELRYYKKRSVEIKEGKL